MKIAITGATGFIGSHLVDYLQRQGDEVIIISRSAGSSRDHAKQKQKQRQQAASRTITWHQLIEQPKELEGVDAIINLAGETINQRWTAKAKQRIVQSRVDAAERLAQAVFSLERKPQVLINASGMSIYGTSEHESFDEDSPPRLIDFLSSVVDVWEQSADSIAIPRTVKLRVGLVIGRNGGAYPKMTLPYRLGAGGRVGNGRQWVSWIHIEDMVRLIDYCLRDECISGPVNATAPNPVTNDELGRAVARASKRPHWFPVPAWVMKLIFGELSVLLLEGQRVLPKKLLEHGYSFRYPQIEDAVQQLETTH